MLKLTAASAKISTTVFPLFVLPLRERRGDILLPARNFLARIQPEHPGFDPKAVRQIEAHPWPGNVWELENWVEYAAVMSGGKLTQFIY
jgi:DNA-binding NtrC family response regulator